MDTPIITQSPPQCNIKEFTFIVRWPNGGGSRIVTIQGPGHLEKVIQDGLERAPKTHDIELVYRWLQAHGYVPVSRNWTEPPSYNRRSKETWRHKSLNPVMLPAPFANLDDVLPVAHPRPRDGLFKV